MFWFFLARLAPFFLALLFLLSFFGFVDFCLRALACCWHALRDTPCWLEQGQELEALRAATPYQHIVYCGDGANDLCPALALASTDTVLARKVRLLFLPLWTCSALELRVGISCSTKLALLYDVKLRVC